MGKFSRRRRRAAVAALLASAPKTALCGTARPRGGGASSTSVEGPPGRRSRRPSSSSLSTAFSCGTRWREARTCSDLCPSGDDSACPPGQRCFAGIPCDENDDVVSGGGGGGGSAMDAALERQRDLESREVDRLRGKREETHVGRFVCGESYEDAEAVCDGGGGDDSSSAVLLLPSSVGDGDGRHYCPTGSSSRCPADTECYAAVYCPRRTHDEEPPLIGTVSLRILNSLATEPMLLGNVTHAAELPVGGSFNGRDDGGVLVGGGEAGFDILIPKAWRSFFGESHAILN